MICTVDVRSVTDKARFFLKRRRNESEILGFFCEEELTTVSSMSPAHDDEDEDSLGLDTRVIELMEIALLWRRRVGEEEEEQRERIEEEEDEETEA